MGNKLFFNCIYKIVPQPFAREWFRKKESTNIYKQTTAQPQEQTGS